MKKMQLFSLFLTIALAISLLSIPVSAAETNPAVTSGCHSLDAAMTLSNEEKLAATAKAVVLYELNSGTMLYTWNPDAKIYPTSMVKMMTVLVALENGILDEMVTVTRQMLQQVPIGILGADLKREEEISLKDLLYCTMVASATDASVVVAEHIGGSVGGFLLMMNEKAAELGCQNTNYSNVHGLHDENTYTTARDIARITAAALENEVFREIFCTAEYTLAATNKHEERKITTTNNMMNSQKSKYYDKRVTGGKTGSTDEGGRCLTLTAEYEGMEILCVLMGATPTLAANGSIEVYGSFEESKEMLDYAFKNFEYRQVFFDGQSLAQYPVEGGASHVVTQAAASISTIMPTDVDTSQLKWAYELQNSVISAPVIKGQMLGAVQVWYGTKCLAQTEMLAMHAVEQYQAPVIPEKPAGSGGGWLIILLVLIAAAAAGFFGLTFLRRKMIRYRRRQQRRSRRR